MSTIEIIILALSLSIDASAVSLALSAGGHLADKRARFRISFHFGLFQFMMPVAGWFVGTRLEPAIATFDHWVAFGLLTLVAVRMIRSGGEKPNIDQLADPSRGWNLVTLSTATSIDALAVGLGLGALEVSVWYSSFMIGAITMVMCIATMALGERAGRWLGTKGQIFAGIVLLLVAIKIVITHSL